MNVYIETPLLSGAESMNHIFEGR